MFVTCDYVGWSNEVFDYLKGWWPYILLAAKVEKLLSLIESLNIKHGSSSK